MPAEQRRGRKIAMDKAELDAFLGGERTCRLATSSPQGPHLTALWFAWDGTAMWIYSIVRSQRWTDLERDGRIAVLVDAGEDYFELRGAERHRGARRRGAVDRRARPRVAGAGKTHGPQVPRRRLDDQPRRPPRLAPAGPRQDHQLGLQEDPGLAHARPRLPPVRPARRP